MNSGDNRSLFTARISDTCLLAEAVPYSILVRNIVECTLRAAVARSIDQSEWEHEQLRRNGLGILQIFRDGKAVWNDPNSFHVEFLAAQQDHVEAAFTNGNELDPALYLRLDHDLRARWRLGGYHTFCLLNDMKPLFTEIEKDAAEYAESAREGLVGEVLLALFPERS